MAIRTLDLFCGAGGSSWGAQRAGASIVCGVDAWPLATQAYQRNFPDSRAVNVRLTEDTRPEELGDLGRIDLLLASPECTNHTCARGGRARDEASKATARYVVKFAEALQPRWVVVENVVQMSAWHGYQPLIQDLRSLGYYIRPEVLDASDFGVAQTRRRLFVLCDREKQPGAVTPARKPAPSAADILDIPGSWKMTELLRDGRALATLERADRAMHVLPRRTPFLIVYYGSDGSGGWQSLERPLRTITTLDRFALVTWQGDVPMMRMLQVPELMRAMGFSKGYTLDGLGCRRSRIRLLGNGVAPPVMEAIVRALSRPAVRHAPEQERVLEAA